MASKRKPLVLVAGYYAEGDGYPNGRVTQSLLAGSLGLGVRNLGTAMAARPLWKMAGDHAFTKMFGLARIALHNIASALRVLWYRRRSDVVYVRYPAIPFMLLMSLIPKRFRPVCYVDAFISLWDSMFVDRRRDASGRIARLVRALEQRALAAADKVLVDTIANAMYLAETFTLEPERVIALPLGVDESAWLVPADSKRIDPRFTVTFVGTFIPLHGIDLIADAIARFDADEGILFRFIGDGQESPLLARLIACKAELAIDWQREWRSPNQIATIAAQSDICLGVFGGGGKAARVLPYKLYLYLCLGTATITQSSLSTPTGTTPPVLMLDRHDGESLAAAIRRLKNDTDLRARLGREGRAYFKRYLGNEALTEVWRRILPNHFFAAISSEQSQSS